MHILLRLIFLMALCRIEVVHADEGFWLFTDLPVKKVQENYHFHLTHAFTESLMKSSIRMPNGATGAFVSEDGLFITSKHLIDDDAFGEAVTPYIVNGYTAYSRLEEIYLPRIRVLNVVSVVANHESSRVAEKHGLADKSVETRQSKHEIQRYKEYKDVRLVFCPPDTIAYVHWSTGLATDKDLGLNLDSCLFRVYEHRQPARTSTYMRLSREPIHDGQLVFSTGFPRATDRFELPEMVKYRRDVELPRLLNWEQRLQVVLKNQGSAIARAHLDASVIRARAYQRELAWRPEDRVDSQVKVRPGLQESISVLEREGAKRELLRGHPQFFSTANFYASTMLEIAEEIGKPEGQRSERFREPLWSRLRSGLGKEDEAYDADTEEAELALWLQLMIENSSTQNALVASMLAGRTPQTRAREIIDSTQLGDYKFRGKLLGGTNAEIVRSINGSHDSLLEFIRRQKKGAERATAKVRSADITISHIREAAWRAMRATGTVYPDADDTLRFEYGAIAGNGLRENQRRSWSNLGDLNAWIDAGGGFANDLSMAWQMHRSGLAAAVPLNVSANLDFSYGSSGGPVVDERGDLLGVAQAFIPSKVPQGEFDTTDSRMIFVSSAGLLEILKGIYGAARLAKELETGSSRLLPLQNAPLH